MIITDKVENTALLSSAMQVGEFRIKNSSKAFAILSSGLYANKIRAIIRELSCNAVDAHIAAGKPDEPIECHLPNALEPWFAIRDKGIGLSHDSVVNIYTTYFESTKTDSNDYIGALGLGSKSPFSYTENFTVTAIKDGTKGIYSAFINDQGLPSIVLLQSEKTAESNGVEVKFAVNQDFDKFRQEAASVYTWFKVKPVVKGATIHIPSHEYVQKDFAKGIHLKSKSTRSMQSCVAIMGNIAYPINVPNISQLGSLAEYLKYEFHMEFDIGELDIQASREGLSYIKSTIDAIKAKLEVIHNSIEANVIKELDGVTGVWESAEKYNTLNAIELYRHAIKSRLTTLKHPMLTTAAYRSALFHDFNISKETLDEYNIAITSFTRSYNGAGWRTVKTERNNYDHNTRQYTISHNVGFSPNAVFIKNDLKIGALARAKNSLTNRHNTYYVVSVANKTKPNRINEFMKVVLHQPPAAQIMLASSFAPPERVKREKKTKLIKLTYTSYARNRNKDWVWKNIDESSITDWKDVVYVRTNGLVVNKNGAAFPIHSHYVTMQGIKVFTLIGVDEEGEKVMAKRGVKEYFAYTDSLVKTFISGSEYQKAVYYSALNGYEKGHLEGFAKVLAQIDFSKIDNKAGRLYTVGTLMVLGINQGSSPYGTISAFFRTDTTLESRFKNDVAAAVAECEALVKTYQMLSLVDYIKLYTNRSTSIEGKQIVISYINQIGV